MERKEVIIRYGLFLVVILVLLPFLLSMFIELGSFSTALRASYVLSYTFIIVGVAFFVFLLLSQKTLQEIPTQRENTLLRIVIGLIGVILIFLAFPTYGSFERNLEFYEVQNGKVSFDHGRILGFLGESDVLDYNAKSVLIHPLVHYLPFNGTYHTGTLLLSLYYEKNGAFDSLYYLGVNNNTFNITPYLVETLPGKTALYRFSVPQLQATNVIVVSQAGDDPLYVNSQIVYSLGNSFYNESSQLTPLLWDSFLIGFEQKKSFLYIALYKLGVCMKILAMILFFIAIFGFTFTSQLVKKAWREFIFSTIFTLFIYYFIMKIYQYWYVLSRIISYTLYGLFKILGFHPSLYFGDNPTLGIPGVQLDIAAQCSGIEGISLFIIIFTFLIIFFWPSLHKGRVFLLYVPGVIGVFLVNILRIFSIYMVAKFISLNFAINSFHTQIGMVLFILYTLVFWYMALPWIMKK